MEKGGHESVPSPLFLYYSLIKSAISSPGKNLGFAMGIGSHEKFFLILFLSIIGIKSYRAAD